MKKLVIFLSVLILGLSAVFADEYPVSTIKAFDVKDYYEQELTLKYDDSENVYYLFRSTYRGSYWFTLTPTKLEKLRATVKKAQEWSAIAIEKKTSVKKELPDSELKVPGTLHSGSDWYTTRWDLTLKYHFVAEVNDTTSIVSILLVGDEEASRQNQYMDIEFPSYVFINSQIDDLANAISEETIKKAKENHKAEKEAADMFN